MTATLPPRTRPADPDAVNRLDDGHGLPGDTQAADRFDSQCRQSYEGFQARLDRLKFAVWLEAHREVCDGCDHCDGAA